MSLTPRLNSHGQPIHSDSDQFDSYGGYPSTPESANDMTEMVDWFGGLWRRKWVWILLALVGLGVGYLQFNRELPIYSSTMKLMIWVQAPPSVINGDTVVQQVSLPKHQNLLVSEVVLGNAIKLGSLDQPGTLNGPPVTVPALKNMIKVIPTDRGLADTLVLTANGSDPTDLPEILNFVVAAYKNVIGEDSARAGQESVELIEKLQSRLLDDQKTDQEKYQTLLGKLNLSAENERGQWINPYAQQLMKLREERDRAAKELRDTELQINQIKVAKEGRKDLPEFMRLMVFEAKRYLKMFDSSIEESQSFSVRRDLRRAERLAENLAKISEERSTLEARKVELLKDFGSAHPSVTAVDSQIEALGLILRQTAKELEDVQSIVSAAAKPSTEDSQSSERELIQLYAYALANDRERQTQDRDTYDQEIARVEAQSKAISADMAQLNLLKSQIEERRMTIAQILERLSTMNVLSNNYTTTKVRVIDPPKIGALTHPKLLNFLLYGLIGGGLLGGLLAIAIDHSDLAFRTPMQILDKLRVPVVCRIPKIGKTKMPEGFKGSQCLVTAIKSNSVAAESFRAGRASLMFLAKKVDGKVFLFTSPSPGDGKSTITTNFAVSLAQMGQRVLLVDADFRRPRVNQYLGMGLQPGFCDYLNGAPIEKCVRPSEIHPNLDILTTGLRPKDPGEIVTSHAFRKVIAEMRENYDLVLIDSPPLLPVADAAALSNISDGVFLVLRIRRGVMMASRRAKEQLDLVNAPVLGVIVNGLDNNPHYYDYGYYGYGYGYGKKYGRYYDTPKEVAIASK